MSQYPSPLKNKNNLKFERKELIEIINYVIDEKLIPETSFAFKFFGICNKKDSLNLILNATDQFFYNNFSESLTFCIKIEKETFFFDVFKFDSEYAIFPLESTNYLALSNRDKKSLIEQYEFIVKNLENGYYKNEKL